MKTKDFLYLCLTSSINIAYNEDKNLDHYKTLTKYFDYPCDFDKYGRCVNHTTPMCCCKACGTDVGYLRNIRLTQGASYENTKLIKKYAKLYNKETGFWNKSKGCSLPRNMRSVLCVGFVCYKIKKEVELKNGTDVIEFLTLLRGYNKLKKQGKHRIYELYVKIGPNYNIR